MGNPQHPASLASRRPSAAIDYPTSRLESLTGERIQSAKIERVECLHRYMHDQRALHL